MILVCHEDNGKKEGEWRGKREGGGHRQRERGQKEDKGQEEEEEEEGKTNDTTRNVLIVLDFEADIPPTCFNGFQLSLLFG